MVDPVDEGFEAVLRIGALNPQLALVARPLQPYRLLACASPDYLARHGTPREPADLAGHECVGFSAWPSAFSRQWRFVRDGTEHAVAVGSRLNLSDWGAMYAAALDGYGIVFGYERAVATDLAAGRLVRVLEGYELPARPMHLLYAADRRMTPKLRAFVDWMLRALGPDAPAFSA
ncbi:LysR substrate-binding domain-containing protein [Bordetella hinzii]|uniref:LysR substrate-binding domain-containing protein n=1 Tax=Bordetella hinzii TaxID=103855 RepID=UPI00289CBE9E|nr:LysR substrate-binding domain-containing protein [Bordetella hinzii]